MAASDRNPVAFVLLACLAGFTAEADATEPLHWLSGHWCSATGDGRIEELWLPPAEGQLLGVNRTLQAGHVVAFEFLRIAVVDGVPTYLAQPEGRPPTAFARTDSGEKRMRFENLQHDFPQRIEYHRHEDSLRVEISGPADDGDGDDDRTTIGFDFAHCHAGQ